MAGPDQESQCDAIHRKEQTYNKENKDADEIIEELLRELDSKG